VSPDVPRYRFGPRERGSTLAGWRAGQIITVALGLVIGVLVLRVQPTPAGVGIALVVLILCGALATWPVAGRTGDEWCPVVVCWAARRSWGGGRRRLESLAGLQLLSAGGHEGGRGRGMGVVHDTRARTLTAALSVRGQSFALLGPEDQDRRVGGWSSVLAGLAREGSVVRRVQWLAASFPDQGHGAHDFLAERAVADASSASVASYQGLLADMDADACAHEVVLAVQIRVAKSLELGCSALQREITSLARSLADADVLVDGVLSTDDLARQLLRTYEPRDDLCASTDDPWPMAMDEAWDGVRVDGLWHATFWVAEWPRSEVRSDFLAPLLLGSTRAVLSVVMEPLGPEEATRKVEASRTADLADSELRRRGGFISTARRTRESEVLARREAELAEGHASFRYAGFVTVSAPTQSELATACDTVQHAAGQCRLALRRLYGDQAAAYTNTLPLGRGLR
jgi:hypothetical protein